MNPFNSLILLSSFCLLIACHPKNDKASKGSLSDSVSWINTDTSAFSTSDTTTRLRDNTASTYHGPTLTATMAKNILYHHFNQKGYYDADHIPDDIIDVDGKMSIDFDTIFHVDLNNTPYSDAIITYWQMPLYASGHCWQPHKAVLLDTDSGYQVVHEEFIPPNYFIDSIGTVNRQLILYGYDYNCAMHTVVKKLRIRIR